MQRLSFFLFAISSIFLFTNCETNYGNTRLSKKELTDTLAKLDSFNRVLIRSKSEEAKIFSAEKDYNEEYCFLINMKIHSGKYRFFVWDLKNNIAIDSGLVSHGCGDHTWGWDESATEPVFSNVYESHCSSLGKYKVGKRDWSQWGINVKYYLHGLDSTNSNALGRQIVFHSWNMIFDSETFPAGTPEGWGCPAISNEFMKRVDEKLKTTEKPVLMWVFNN
ncbi:MAG: murein L,D-transpeptidase catalytic domain-containing protein [Chitinophagales bacterium]